MSEVVKRTKGKRSQSAMLVTESRFKKLLAEPPAPDLGRGSREPEEGRLLAPSAPDRG